MLFTISQQLLILFPWIIQKIKVFSFKCHHDPIGRFSFNFSPPLLPHGLRWQINEDSEEAYDPLSLPSPKKDQPRPLPTNTNRNGVQDIVYFFTITSSEEINLVAFRRTCQVNLSLQFLLNKSKDISLNLNKWHWQEVERRGRQGTSYLETTGALFVNGYQTRGREKRKEH